jgi:hypothetical protein
MGNKINYRTIMTGAQEVHQQAPGAQADDPADYYGSAADFGEIRLWERE